MDIPGIGQVVEAGLVAYLVYHAIVAIHLRGIGSDPARVKARPASIAGMRDENGVCTDAPPPGAYNWKWQAIDASHGLHWHWVNWNRNSNTRQWYPSGRFEGPNDPGSDYVLIEGIWGDN